MEMIWCPQSFSSQNFTRESRPWSLVRNDFRLIFAMIPRFVYAQLIIVERMHWINLMVSMINTTWTNTKISLKRFEWVSSEWPEYQERLERLTLEQFDSKYDFDWLIYQYCDQDGLQWRIKYNQATLDLYWTLDVQRLDCRTFQWYILPRRRKIFLQSDIQKQ